MTIASSRDIEAVFQQGRRFATPELIGLVASTPESRGPRGRVAFIAGKKLGPAVKRNRSKRVMREAVRRAHGPWAGWDVLLVARPSTATATPEALDRALASVLSRAEIS